jgi:hypothetical protein
VIPAIAVIISTYAVARLLCTHVLEEDQFKLARILISLIAIAIIAVFLNDIISASDSLGNLGI